MLHLDGGWKMGKAIINSKNLTDKLNDEDLKRLGAWCYAGYDQDLRSRYKWEKRSQAALDLAQQVVIDKTFPWPGAANVAFPLVTIAAMQFHARAYPAIVDGFDLVKYRVPGGNAQPEETARGEAIAATMNYQLLEEDQSWEEQEDRLLLCTAIVGTSFKKTYHVAEGDHNVSEMVMAKDLVCDYHAKSIESCPRKTHVIPMYRNEIYEKVQLGLFLNCLDAGWYKGLPQEVSTDTSVKTDNRQGGTTVPADETTPFRMLEQHCWIDFDGDGYAEPYIVTLEEGSREVVRIVSRCDREVDIERKADGTIIRIVGTEYFTKRGFIPSPDGGIMDIGFGLLLGPINESVSTIINQMLDNGTMAIAGGGFLGRGAKIRGGAFTFAPNQWLRVDSTGDDLHKSVVPLPVPQAPAVLFQLLGLLIEYSNRISSATDMMVGENPGQNTPAQTSQTMVEQGMKIYSAIFKRQWRGLKAEFKKLFKLNAVFLPADQRTPFLGDPNRVIPAADPHVVSDGHRMQQAMLLKSAAQTTSGYNVEAVENRFLKALKVEAIAQVYPGVGDPKEGKVPPLPNPKLQIEQMRQQTAMQKVQVQMKQFLLELQSEAMLVKAKIIELYAKAALEQAEAKGVGDGHAIAKMEMMLAALKARDDSLRSHIELAMKGAEQYGTDSGQSGAGLPGVAPPPGNESVPAMAAPGG